ncbi:MAG: zinc ribbon domain-containing protein [Candidatus Heimdallarchaeota archaeon]|nr:zinc ribbon domain-containing protein [Candidatus Heimdallarchaeota archaeon]MCK4877480.1 zinc ribbon domain-containing protein [Candidatus Heimdallarchaeota archaeon]
MISDISRKRITLAALICVLSILASMFAVFLQNEERLTAVIFLLLGLNIVLYAALIWLGVNLYFFHKEETSGIVEMGTTVIIEQGINKDRNNWKQPLFQISLALIVGGSIGIPIQIVRGLLVMEVFTLSNPDLVINLISILPAVFMLFGFIQLKRELDIYAAKKRNIYKGQTSLPIGYLMIIIYLIVLSIFPLDFLLVETAEGTLAIRAGYEIVYYIMSFLEIGQDVMFVLGFWYLRRAFTILDKVPEEYFERKQQIIEQTQARRQQGFRGSIFRNSRTLGTVLPQTPIKEEPKEEDAEFAEEHDVKKMFCVKCGLELEEDAVFCANCGEENPYLKR